MHLPIGLRDRSGRTLFTRRLNRCFQTVNVDGRLMYLFNCYLFIFQQSSVPEIALCYFKIEKLRIHNAVMSVLYLDISYETMNTFCFLTLTTFGA